MLARRLVDPHASNLDQRDAFEALTAIGDDVDVGDAVEIVRAALLHTDERPPRRCDLACRVRRRHARLGLGSAVILL